ncbi:hypothetical protein JCGZ_24147 [Jatropha curcas]|uniref:Uncharacterized protein n=1 Tax=Jatropha curcas TaxID=180498 RepID=A0A067JSC7_JATCU|nr:hypothetical protein JCGZ_24147 [Jatropha curcas]
MASGPAELFAVWENWLFERQNLSIHTMSVYLSVRIDPSREITMRAWHRRPAQRLVKVSPIPEPAPVSPMVHSSSSDSDSDSDLVEMADVNAIGSGLPEELVLAEAELEEKMCAMLNIWDDCSSEEEVERKPVKVEIEKSITVQAGEVPDNEDEQIQLAIQKSLADQADQCFKDGARAEVQGKDPSVNTNSGRCRGS